MKLILMLQQNNNRITVDDIAEKFNVSHRTVYRDFNALSEMNVPVTWDKYKGYQMVSGYKIPPLMFTSRELATILVGLNFVKSQVDQTLIEDAEGVELKFKEVVPEELLEYMESLKERMVVDPFLSFGADKKEGGNWYLISQAISKNRTIKFDYQAKSSETISTRKIDPYLIVFYRDHWNLIGYSHKRGAKRNFVLDRMSNTEITEEDFIPYGKIDVEQLIFPSEESSYLVEVDIDVSAVDRFKANLPANIFKFNKIKTKLFRAKFYFDNLDFINEWLLQFPKEVEIRGPELLIEKRTKLLKEMMEKLPIS